VIYQVTAVCSLAFYVYVHEPAIGFLLLAALSTGINSGSSGIVIAHELVHRREGFMRFLGKVMLFAAGNFYFFVDHVKGHHRWVGTPQDPSSSRKGENVFAFAVRSSSGQALSSWNLEVHHLRRAGLSPYGFRNYVVSALLLQLLAALLIWYFLGWWVLAAMLLQGIIACFLLEYTQYIEHYGLSRKGMERVSEIHSWQTDKVVSRFFLIDLSRHADHHYHASKPYHTLLSHKGSPVLPGGYVSLIYYALVPPLFFRKVNPVLDDFLKARD
jgi:alkane 1-monooxygenase